MKKEDLKIVAEDFVDGTRFGYDSDVSVEIPGQLLYALMRLVGQLANDEVKWMYEINQESLAETANPNNVKNVISNEGITYFNVLGELESLHMRNIKNGKTLPIEEVQEKIQAKIEAALKAEEDKVTPLPDTDKKARVNRKKK